MSPRKSPSKRPVCDTPGCGRPIPVGGEGHPEICPECLRVDELTKRAAALATRIATLDQLTAEDRRLRRDAQGRAEAAERLVYHLLHAKYAREQGA